MPKILVIRSSAAGAASVSNTLVDAYLGSHADAMVIERDLDAQPVPHVTQASLAGIGRNAPEGNDFAEARSLQDDLIAEVFDADTLVIGLPLYNFGMPSTLKAWFDYVARAGSTFRYTPQGPEGLVKGKRAILAHARSGKYDDALGFPFALAHVKALLAFLGITDVEEVTAEGLAFGPDAASASVQDASKRIAALL